MEVAVRYHYVWLMWASAFLVPWTALYLGNARLRRVMLRASLATAAFGLTEPIFVPSYWLPPSLFDLAQRTRFDVESFIFSFAIGGVGVVLYNAVLFLGFYAAFMAGLTLSAPGYIGQVWNLPALSGVVIRDIPLEEFLFGAAFGLYWRGVYEHLTGTSSVVHVQQRTGS